MLSLHGEMWSSQDNLEVSGILSSTVNLPLISVVINGYRRPEALLRAVQSARAQVYAPKEIIVVCSVRKEDDLSYFRRAEFSDVRLLIGEDCGPCAARNRGVEAAIGEFVATIDDDTYFTSENELTNLALAFERHPEASCVIFNVVDPDGHPQLRDWCHPRSFWDFAGLTFETCYIPEGAAAFRRQHFLQIGGYYEPFWLGDEGWDLALRMLDSQMTLIYDPEIRLHHGIAREGRPPGRIYRLKGRNCIWTAFKDYGGWRRLQFLAYTVALMGFLSLSSGDFIELIKGLFEGLTTFGRIKRTPISERGWYRLQQIKSLKPGLWIRLRKLHHLRLHSTPQ